MASYVPGDRLWVRLEGFDWWPARALSDKELAAALDGQTREPGCDLVVLFYPGSQTGESITQLNSVDQAHNICYFETSSEKAVTDSDDLRVAIQTASEDPVANPLKVDQAAPIIGAAGAGQRQAGTAAGASPALAARRAAAKRARGDSDSDDEGGYRGAHGGAGAGEDYRSLSVHALRDVAQRINAALAENDVPSLRIILCDLDNVDVTLSALQESKIGVAVGNILGNAASQPLWPLARALISFWARHLETTTLEAIRRVQEGSRVGSGPGAGVVPVPGSPMSPGSPLRLDAFGSPTTASPTTTTTAAASGASPTQAKPQRMRFVGTIAQLLDSPDNSVPVSSKFIEQLARELAEEVRNPDERSVLISRLRRTDLAYVRENLITGRWSAKQYAEQPDEAFVTASELAAEEQRIAEKLKAADNAAMAGVNVTALFKCGNCGSRNCAFHEQQTRGADEPTTKFITCLSCKKAWTEE